MIHWHGPTPLAGNGLKHGPEYCPHNGMPNRQPRPRADMSKLADALFSRTKQNVLGLLYARPARSFYTNEILRLTGMGVATIKRELDRMVDADIIKRTITGNQHHYQANPYCAVYAELSSIMHKTAGIADVLENSLQPLWPQIDSAVVYGFKMAAQTEPDSAIALLITSKTLDQQTVLSELKQARERLKGSIELTLIKVPDEQQPALDQLNQQPRLWLKGEGDDLQKTG